MTLGLSVRTTNPTNSVLPAGTRPRPVQITPVTCPLAWLSTMSDQPENLIVPHICPKADDCCGGARLTDDDECWHAKSHKWTPACGVALTFCPRCKPAYVTVTDERPA